MGRPPQTLLSSLTAARPKERVLGLIEFVSSLAELPALLLRRKDQIPFAFVTEAMRPIARELGLRTASDVPA